MAPEKDQFEKQLIASVVSSPASSCRKHGLENATFLEDVKYHMHDFIHASLDEHKTCFKKGMQKMFGMSKVVAERGSEVKSSLHLRSEATE